MSKYPDKFVSYSVSDPNYSVTGISFIGSVTGGIILVLYFLIISMTGYNTITGLRFLNFILLVPLVVISLRRYIENATGKSYLEAFSVSFLTFVGSYVILSLFMILYLTAFDRDFLEYLQNSAAPELKLNAFGVAALLIGEGIVGGIISTFVILQFFKNRIRKFA